MNLLRNKLLLLIITVLFTGFVHGQKAPSPVVINGTLAEKGSYTKIYLDTLNSQNPWIFATADITPDGKFRIEASISNTDIFRLRLDDENYMMLILSPGENITLKSTEAKLGSNTVTEGSVHTQLLYGTMNELQGFESRKAMLNKQFNDINHHPGKIRLPLLL